MPCGGDDPNRQEDGEEKATIGTHYRRLHAKIGQAASPVGEP
jgi:hypothetical protein